MAQHIVHLPFAPWPTGACPCLGHPGRTTSPLGTAPVPWCPACWRCLCCAAVRGGQRGAEISDAPKTGNRCIGRFLCAEVRGGGGVLPAQRARQNPIVGAPRAAGALAKPQNLNAIFEAFSGLFPHRCQKRRKAACAPIFENCAPNCAPTECRNVAHFPAPYRTTQASIQGVFRGKKKKAARLWNDAAL